jgi:YVTN family beta-propeller protein
MNRVGGAVAVGVAALICGSAVGFAASAENAALPRGGKVIARVRIPQGYGGFAVGEGAVWAMSDLDSTLTRIDPQGNKVAARIKVVPVNPCPPYVCGEPAAGDGAVWVPRASDNTVSRIDLASNTVTARIPVGPRPISIALTTGAVWVANSGGPTISRIDPATNQVVATIRVGPPRAASDRGYITSGRGAIWMSVPNLNSVVRVDPATNAVTATIHVSDQPCGFLAADVRAVWASGAHCSAGITRIDPRTNAQTQIVRGEIAPIGLALGFGSLWVADIDRKTIDRVNPRTGRIVARLPVGGIPIRLAAGFGSVWVRDDTGRVLRIRPHR